MKISFWLFSGKCAPSRPLEATCKRHWEEGLDKFTEIRGVWGIQVQSLINF